MHLTDEILAPIRARYGEPDVLEWEGEISEREHGIATYNPRARCTTSPSSSSTATAWR